MTQMGHNLIAHPLLSGRDVELTEGITAKHVKYSSSRTSYCREMSPALMLSVKTSRCR